MKTTPLKKINKQWEFVCNEYIIKFCNKQNLSFDGWIADEIGGIALFIGQYSFNLSDIVLDLNSRQKKGFILNWQNDLIDYNLKNNGSRYINYKSYIMGLRCTHF